MNPEPAFLDGRDIYLREVRASDVNDNYYRWMNDPSVTRFLETRYVPQSKESILSFVRSMDGNRDQIFLAICAKENGLHIGNIKIGPVNWVHGFADISLLIGEKDFWGRGLATEAISMVTAFAFNTLNLNKVKAGCYSGNKGSEKAFIKAGFTKEGTLKNHWRVKGGFLDEILLGLCYDDWNTK